MLLKGPSIATWLYRDGAARPYVDSDLLVAAGSYSQARDVLRELGFRPFGYSWHRDSETWRRRRDATIVDLHRSLIGISAPPDTAWEELATDTDTLRVGGIDVDVLRVPARALHVALHAAEHGGDVWHPLEDLARALRVANDDVWHEAAAVARRIDAVPAFAAGLRFHPAGVRLAERLELPDERPPAVAVRAGPDVPVAITLEHLTSEQPLRARARLLLRALVPPPRYLRHWSTMRMSAWPAALRRGPLGLILAYLWRPIWILLRLPRAFIAVRRARRDQA
ncbi:MAG: nucleotidyltransferase family protein [Solirubrobacterales bacterium]